MIYKIAKKDDIILEIHYDETPMNPRGDFDNLGTMVCWHNRYDLGDKHNFTDSEDWIYSLAEECGIETWMDDGSYGNSERIYPDIIMDAVKTQAIIMPIFLYDHSGITISIGDFHDTWDSGQVGWIYVTYDAIKKEYGKIDEEIIALAKSVLESEIELYDQYLRGDVYGFVLEKESVCDCCGHKDCETLDSCWGFYGTDFETNGMRDYIPDEFLFLLNELEYA